MYIYIYINVYLYTYVYGNVWSLLIAPEFNVQYHPKQSNLLITEKCNLESHLNCLVLLTGSRKSG